jgi:serine/threonine protein kinase
MGLRHNSARLPVAVTFGQGLMELQVDIEEFIYDYVSGTNDRDLMSRHKLTRRELVFLARKLISEGLISKEDYFNRNKRMEELEAKQEKDFLKSLHHCPVCGHIQPTPFTICPACERDITKFEAEKSKPKTAKPLKPKRPTAPPPPLEVPKPREVPKPPELHKPREAPKPREVPKPPEEPKLEAAYPEILREPIAYSEDLNKYIGMPLDNIVTFDEDFSAFDYHISGIISSDNMSNSYYAEDANGQGPRISAKFFRQDLLPDSVMAVFLEKLIQYQSGMADTNILSPFGSASLDDTTALLYPFMPKTLESLLGTHPEGIPMDTVQRLLRQMLNALGYTHMHRDMHHSGDGAVHRLPHMYLKLSAFHLNDEENLIKLADCGVWSSMIYARGHLKHLWEEPGIDPSALPPESFVYESKAVNGFYADIYSLGAAIYRLITGRLAFNGKDIKEYSFLHLKTFPVPPRVHRWQIPAWLDHMVLKCLIKEPTKRWRSATQMELSIGRDILAEERSI